MSPLEAVLIGAGQRGTDAVGAYAKRNPQDLKFVAVAELDEGKRKRFAEQHNIPEKAQFASYQDLLAKPKIAPLCFNTTMDKTHLESSLAAFDHGYHLFLEKPMSDSPMGCLSIAQAATERKLMVQICHPLRYTPFYLKVKELLREGTIGSIISLSMYENIGFWHYAHSYVRGNWRRQDTSGPMILTKCCHDMDLATWIVDAKVKNVASFGPLRFFREENAPEGAPKRCTDHCPVEKTCPFAATAFYLKRGNEWPVSVISIDQTHEARKKAIETGPYGHCVFRNDNDVVDHQVVDAEFENSVTLNFAVRANTLHCYRTIRVIGTEGEINGHFEDSEIRVARWKQGQGLDNPGEFYSVMVGKEAGAHGGGDTGVIRNFLRAFQEEDYAGIQHSLDIAVEGHMLAFAAEKARQEAKVISLQDYKKSIL